MALPVVASFVGKGVAIVKGVSAAKLAKAGIGVVSTRRFLKQFSNKEKDNLEKQSKKKGIEVDFDIRIRNKKRNSNKAIHSNCNGYIPTKHKKSKYKR